MAVFNGTNLLLKVATDGSSPVTIGHTTSASMSLSLDTPEATTKDSGGFADYIAGLRSGEISFEGLVNHGASNASDEMSDFLLNRTEIDWTFSTGTTGDEIYSGGGFISSLEVSAEMESPVSYSGTITITGTISQATNA